MKWVITAASFEERCLALPESLPEAGSEHRAAVIDFAGYEDVAPYLFNRHQMLALLAQKGYSVERIPVEITRPLEGMGHLTRVLMSADDVLLDISALPRNYLFGICRVLADTAIPTRIRYYRPTVYGGELSERQ